MKQIFLAPAALSVFLGFALGSASAADLTPAIQPSPTAEPGTLRAAEEALQRRAYRQWKVSLAPVVASQGLDVASSYGMRELNPLLAGSDGRFGPRAAGIKLGATAGLLGVEYLLVRKFPGSARVLSKINWSASILTTGFAVHNFSIR
jgi:hypothetical protein